ncbi:MAG: EAL domain-containing protein [Methylophilaceae bacterium]|nr:EAL domain-containing protein [Methylophilaceae bacterium]
MPTAITSTTPGPGLLDTVRHLFHTPLVDALPLGIFVKDLDSVYVSCNARFAQDVGLPRERIVGRTDHDLFPAEQAARHRARDRHVIETGVTETFEEPHRSQQREVWLRTTQTPLRSETGVIIGILGFHQDITDQKAAEQAIKAIENNLKEAQQLAQLGSWELDLVSGRLFWSDEIFNIFEIDPARFGASYEAFLDTVHPDDREMVHQTYTGSVSNRTPYSIVHRLLMADGRIKFVHERGKTLYDEQGKPLRSVGTVQDITAQKLAEEQLNLFVKAFEHNQQAAMITDAHNHILHVNRAFCTLTGYQPHEVLGKNPNILQSNLTPRKTYEEMWRCLEKTDFWIGEVWDTRKDGSTYPKNLSISVIRDEKGRITHYVGYFHDITERKLSEEQIRYLAHHDALTGLPNRFSLVARMEQMIASAKRASTGIAVMFLDLDRFKAINDTMGHHFGDRVLLEVAKRLKQCVRKSDIVSRLGGDEFVIVLSDNTDPQVASHIADKIRETLSAPYQIEDRTLHTTPSIGICCYPRDGSTPAELMKNADTAMYAAKEAGRNGFCFFSPEMNAALQDRIQIEHDLRLALERQEFFLLFQPIVQAEDGRLAALEVLLRWRHRERGLIPPDRFIPIAEASGAILSIGRWVIQEASCCLQRWQKAHLPPVRLAINMSARQLQQPDSVHEIGQIIHDSSVPPELLEFEITESAAMENVEQTTLVLWALRGLGVRLAIDDFGTGYSSLNYLKRFPVHHLKIDRSFIKDVLTDANDAAIATATISLAHSLGIQVVAEGVETHAQCDYLRQHNCDYLQGYLFSRPLPEQDIMQLLAANGGAFSIPEGKQSPQ